MLRSHLYLIMSLVLSVIYMREYVMNKLLDRAEER